MPASVCSLLSRMASYLVGESARAAAVRLFLLKAALDRLLARLDILVESHYLEVQRILNRCGFLTQPVDLFSALVKLAYLRGKLLASAVS